MHTMVKKRGVAKIVLKALVVVACVTGFLLQTLEFLLLYWTYPTVVDIQVSVPSEIELPGITFCSENGMVPTGICKLGGLCTTKSMNFFSGSVCKSFTDYCIDGKTVPPGFVAVAYGKFLKEHRLNYTALEILRIPLKDFFTCKIISGSSERDCDTENTIYGSYYSDLNAPSFCFSLNTLWGNPTRMTQRIKKSEKIQMQFFMDMSHRNKSANPEEVQLPKHNSMGTSSLQLAIHSPQISASPFVSGMGFLGGKRYEIKLKKDEKHLLPPPYQTNCTDYMTEWKARGGVAPLNQVMVIQECRMKAALQEIGCVPYFIDYPHNETICEYCPDCINMTRIGENCTDLLQYNNQPCDSASYHMMVEEKLVYITRIFKSSFVKFEETFAMRQKGYNCTFERVFTKQCQIVNIEVDFDEYEVTNMTYNPKFESLELFSVIGGYMGMYLGISLVAVYDFAEMALGATCRFLKKHSKTKIQQHPQQITHKRDADNYRKASEFRRRTVRNQWTRDFN